VAATKGFDLSRQRFHELDRLLSAGHFRTRGL
jgi:hypothetical protein